MIEDKNFTKICLILTNTSGGLFLFRQELIARLMLFYSVYVITSDTGRIEELKRMGCNVDVIDIDRRGMNPIKDFSLLKYYYERIREINPAVVITYTIKPNIYGGFCSKLLRIPYVANITGLGTGFQSFFKKKLLIVMYRSSLEKAKAILCENSSIKEELIRDRIADAEQIVVVPGAGVNIQRFDYLDYPEDNTIFNFLFIGRVMKEKGINELIDATRQLIEEGYNCKLIVVGGYEEDYTDVIEKNKWIDYKGHQLDVRPFINISHCFVLPSYHEGMANTNLEAAASGRPIITSNIPGCREAVIEGKTGLLCEARDVHSLYIAMKTIIEMDRETRKTMGLNGREYMKCKFDKRIVVEETLHNII